MPPFPPLVACLRTPFSIREMAMKTAAKQLLRALRGEQTQLSFSRGLGYRSNVSAEWESGRRTPNATELLRICRVLTVAIDSAMRRLHPRRSASRPLHDWLNQLRGDIPKSEVARRSGYSRHQVTRWMTGAADPRVCELLGLIEALTGQVATFMSSLASVERFPGLRRRLGRERAARTRRSNTKVKRPIEQLLRQLGSGDPQVLVVPVGTSGVQALRDVSNRTKRDLERHKNDESPAALAVISIGSLPVK